MRQPPATAPQPGEPTAAAQGTYLWVRGIDDVLEKVRDCWASLYTTRAVAYREKNRIAHADVLMSVGVQKMVNPRTAGVAMTLDPVNGDRTRIVIDASWGLGEMVVSGLMTPDNYTVEKVLETIIDRKISDNHVELVGDPALGTTVERAVDAARRKVACLSDAEILAVARLAKRLAKRLERQNKCPQDVEWAFEADLPDGENLVALQSRPETIWSQKKKTVAPKSHATGMMGIVGSLNSAMPVLR